MPRPRKSKPIAAAIEAAEHPPAPPDEFERMVADVKPLTPAQVRGEKPVPAAVTEGMVAFSTAESDEPHKPACPGAMPAPAFGVSLDDRQGVRIDVERERRPGQPGLRVLVRFRNDSPPSPAEKDVLRAEGFAYSVQDRAWVAPKTAANIVLAKRAVNRITHDLRGDTGAALFV